jgi:hypothetical protein
MASLEEVSDYPLSQERREQLFAAQRVCSICWTTSEGWPVGVTHRYVWHDEKIWATTSRQRHRVAALRQRPESCVIISGDGTELGPDCTLTFKTTCRIHEDRETIDWFLNIFALALHPDSPEAQTMTRQMLDSPRRVVLELTPVKTISYDGALLSQAIAREGLSD